MITKLVATALAIVLGVGALLPSALAADESRELSRIGLLSTHADTRDDLRARLKALGWIEGKNVVYEFRDGQGQSARLPQVAMELLRLKPDVIVAFTNVPAFAAKGVTSTIPIVVWAAHDAVGTGLVLSLARPGGNVTGTESLAPELDAKRLQLLKQIVPSLKTLAVLYNPNDQGSPIHLKWTQEAGAKFGFGITHLEVRSAADYDTTLAAAAGKPLDGLLMLSDNVTFRNWPRAGDFALRNRLPTVCEFSQLVDGGCLISYGPTFAEFTERVAQQVDRILRGAKPTELPFAQPTRVELVVNMKTARAIGVAIPQAVLLQATRVIE